MVNAISGQTLRGETSTLAMASFEARLLALSRAHDILLQHSWASASIGAVVQAVIQDAQPNRFDVSGPDLSLGPQATLTLTMLLHEMVTNAAKYGALSRPEGRVGLS